MLTAANEGSWSADLRVRIDYDTKDKDETTPKLYNLSVKDVGTGVVEIVRNLPLDPSAAALIEQQSALVRATTTPTARPDKHADVSLGGDPFDPQKPTQFTVMGPGQDGDQLEADMVPGSDDGTGMYSLAKADLFNLLCIPPFLPASDSGGGRILTSNAKHLAAAFCVDHRAFFIVDPHPDWTVPSQITTGTTKLSTYLTNLPRTTARTPASTSRT